MNTTQYGPTEQARKEKLLWREAVKRKARKALKIASYATTCAIGLICLIVGMKIDHMQLPIVIKTQPMIIWRQQTKPQTAKEVVKPEQAVTPTPVKKSSLMPALVPQVMAEAVPSPTPAGSNIRHPSDEYIANLVKSYDWDYSTAIRLAKSENYYNLTGSFDCARTNTNTDGSVDVGLFQINSIHSQRLASHGLTMEDMKDCQKNADYAFNWVYKHSGWSPWSAYNNGSYINHSIL